MAVTRFVIKRGDTLPALAYSVTDTDGQAVDLTEAVGATFHMVNAAGTLVVDAAATISDAAVGEITYAWAAEDTESAGACRGEFELDWGDGAIQTAPNDGYITIAVVEDLG